MVRRFDFMALAAACVAVVMLGVYVAIMREQDDQPLAWFEAALVLGAALAAYGVYRPVPHRRVALFAAAAILGVCGVLGLLTIGAPILLAGVLCLLAALLERPVVSTGSTAANR
jgi:hypothetical protein